MENIATVYEAGWAMSCNNDECDEVLESQGSLDEAYIVLSAHFEDEHGIEMCGGWTSKTRRCPVCERVFDKDEVILEPVTDVCWLQPHEAACFNEHAAGMICSLPKSHDGDCN